MNSFKQIWHDVFDFYFDPSSFYNLSENSPNMHEAEAATSFQPLVWQTDFRPLGDWLCVYSCHWRSADLWKTDTAGCISQGAFISSCDPQQDNAVANDGEGGKT